MMLIPFLRADTALVGCCVAASSIYYLYEHGVTDIIQSMGQRLKAEPSSL